jgi:hypothetical protein
MCKDSTCLIACLINVPMRSVNRFKFVAESRRVKGLAALASNGDKSKKKTVAITDMRFAAENSPEPQAGGSRSGHRYARSGTIMLTRGLGSPVHLKPCSRSWTSQYFSEPDRLLEKMPKSAESIFWARTRFEWRK